MAQWIRPRTLNSEDPGSNLLAVAAVPLVKALYPHCLVPQKGLKAVSPLVACFLSGQVKWIKLGLYILNSQLFLCTVYRVSCYNIACKKSAHLIVIIVDEAVTFNIESKHFGPTLQWVKDMWRERKIQKVPSCYSNNKVPPPLGKNCIHHTKSKIETQNTVYVVIFANFASQTLRKYPLQFMSIYSTENIKKSHN